MRFEGRVYDGPWEGKHRSEEVPYFHVLLAISYGRIPKWGSFDPTAAVAVRNGYYRWSYPLRAWVFVWNRY